MGLRADNNRDRWRAEEAVRLDIPADPFQHRVARRGERREVRHRAPGDECRAAPGRQAENVEEPAPGDLLQRRADRADRGHAGVLVPRPREPVRSQRRRQGTADDKAEEAAAGGRGRGGGADLIEHGENGGGIGGPIGKRLVQDREPPACLRRHCDAARVEAREIMSRPLDRFAQQAARSRSRRMSGGGFGCHCGDASLRVCCHARRTIHRARHGD